MQLTRSSAVAAFTMSWIAIARFVSAQGCVTGGHVRVIENPPSQPTSACVIPFGNPDIPPIGYRNWDIVIIHDPVAIPGLSNTKTYQIWTDRPLIDSIHSITIVSKNNTASGSTTVRIAPAPGDYFVDVGSVAMTADSTGLVIVDPVAITGNFVGPLYAHRLNLVRADGGLAGDVFLDSHPSQVSNLFVQVVGNIDSDLIQVSTSQNGIPGYIERLESTNGEIGTPSHMVYVLADGSFWKIRAGYINAYMGGIAATGAGSFVQNVRQIETYTTGGHSGAFVGWLDAQRLEDTEQGGNWIKIAGPMQGTLRLGFGFSNTNGGESSTNHFIQIPAGLMQGQLIMQALGGADASNPWTRPVYVGGLTTVDDLNPKPNYAETTSQIGGASGPRAVGRVPYGTHFTDCFPVFTTDVNAFPTLNYGAIDATHPIKIRHYGPVIRPAGGADAFKVERRLAGSTDEPAWIDESGCIAESVDTVGDPNVVKLTPIRALQSGFEYRITQVLNGGAPKLTCAGVVIPTTPPPVALFGREFRFTICGPSLGDADSNGCVNFADITEVNTNWSSTACLKNGGADRDGDVDFADITAGLTFFGFAYCDAACAASFQQASGDGFSTMRFDGEMSALLDGANSVEAALTALGYPSIEAFGLAIANMNDEQRNFELGRLGQLLGE